MRSCTTAPYSQYPKEFRQQLTQALSLSRCSSFSFATTPPGPRYTRVFGSAHPYKSQSQCCTKRPATTKYEWSFLHVAFQSAVAY
jgi:hypothetical protein